MSDKDSSVVANKVEPNEEPDQSNILPRGISSLLGPVLCDIDKSVVAAHQSQEDLGKEIERLIAELEVFADIAEPPRLQPALDILADARKRLTVATKLMQQTQARIQRIQVALEK
ncbi:hypothetical protein PHYBLDRAFT_189219 [Phycomyces blakesleeanus NRRL 1555(-)]|uniref:Biogenesis of lysosome-related organelles complex 1 subunit 7 n=1 Tax=Phycomyces blakesleeanus (strain ATCC 8743b / DSM 1359 / FGSC 10004 / NBRC 33097 / NRRL 1555) TaxID=763407 RepID=A0A162WES5_PHYB8|nr:hypothetical protein PHYBLDRAFT_189219 [Phycomyces blakesleeanus NRRL 1555(-)]OAD66635.1 hypothetical protein PHYBLDRAFT_189219 [Phycomyces blakesleeanus NRRL 1555(-)]|eukprot:XP_018284675.1 hypothetical protein PHYBLDRAFT_189219 [Phycomyces blakesleeanus NRRL 1555(-)]